MQVVCYDMMLHSTYGSNDSSVKSVFYSGDIAHPRRNILSENREKQSINHVRNHIVHWCHKVANHDYHLFYHIQKNGIPSTPVFLQPLLQVFQTHYKPVEIQTKYYNELFSFSLRELIAGKVGIPIEEEDDQKNNGFAGLWLDSIPEKEGNYKIIYDLLIDCVDVQNGYISLKESNLIPHSFREADIVILYPQTKQKSSAIKQHILKGTIKEINNEQIVISLTNKQTDYSFFNDFNNWAIEPDFMERNYWSSISSLFNLLRCENRRIQILLGNEEPVSLDQFNVSSNHLTTTENNCITKALNAQDYFLLQGPPGTGKTSTFLIEYLRNTLHLTKDKIVVLAFTNKAVNKICENLRIPRNGNRIEYIRLGSKHVEDPFLLSDLLRDDNPDNWRNTIRNCRLLVSTVSTFQNNLQILQKFNFKDQIIIDEASQLTEASIAGMLPVFKKYILIGDHKQLPAVITQPVRTCNVHNNHLHQYGISDHRISLFERLIWRGRDNNWNHAYGQLCDHYRMHDSIADLITEHYYEPLTSRLDAQKYTGSAIDLSPNHLLYKLTQSRTLFIETAPDSVPRRNLNEAKLIGTILSYLLKDQKLAPSQIGVIAPFRAQVVEIQKQLRLKDINSKELLVDTVERFQGDERKLILFSTTVSKPGQVRNIQSIADHDEFGTDRKLLVSLSRASEQVIILGDSSVLNTAPAYETIITKIQIAGGYLSKDWAENLLMFQH